MAAKLGGVFMTCAMGPVRYSAASIQASRMPQGLEELAASSLQGGLRLGIEQAAKLAGVKAQDVERLLPMKELEETLAQIKQSQETALEAWGVHAGQLGGMLKGVADLTVDGREVLPSAGLARIARKVRRDKEFAAPIQALSDAMMRWEELLEQCRDALDSGAELARSYQRRRIRNAVILAVSVAAAVTMIAAVLVVLASRARVDEAIASKDVCAVEGLAEKDLGRAKGEQLLQVAARRRGCEAERAAQAFAQAESKRHAEDVALAAKMQEDLDARCEAMAARVMAGKLTQEDVALAGAQAPILKRIRGKALAPKDLGPTMPELPCEGTRGEGKLREAFVAAAVASIWQWAGVVDPADEVRELLKPRVGDMSERARLALGARAEVVAKQAIRKGNAAAIARAKRLCAFSAALEVPGGEPCDAVNALPAESKPAENKPAVRK